MSTAAAAARLLDSPAARAAMANMSTAAAFHQAMAAWLRSPRARNMAAVALWLVEEHEEFTSALATLDESQLEQTARKLSRSQARFLVGSWVFLVVFLTVGLFMLGHMSEVEAANPFTGGSCLGLALIAKRGAENAFDRLYPPDGWKP